MIIFDGKTVSLRNTDVTSRTFPFGIGELDFIRSLLEDAREEGRQEGFALARKKVLARFDAMKRSVASMAQ
jgi:hypothetical protein